MQLLPILYVGKGLQTLWKAYSFVFPHRTVSQGQCFWDLKEPFSDCKETVWAMSSLPRRQLLAVSFRSLSVLLYFHCYKWIWGYCTSLHASICVLQGMHRLFLPYEMSSCSCNMSLQILWFRYCHNAYIMYKTVGILHTNVHSKFLS